MHFFSYFGRILTFFVCTISTIKDYSFEYSALQARNSSKAYLISDDETESALEEWLKEFFIVAGISIAPRVYLLNTEEVNAGATYGGIIIVNTGFILKCKNAAQLLGVLAHETGHIAGGHLAKASSMVNDASVPAVASLLLGGAAALLTGNPGPLMAGLAGGAHVFERAFLKHTREHEDAADAAAVTYLNKKKWPVSGLFEFLDMLDRHYTTGHEDPYVQTHPLSADRKEKIQLYAKQQPKGYTIPAAYEEKFQRIKAKLFGYLKTPIEATREYPLSNKSISARYARLVSMYVNGKSPTKTREALRLLDELLKEFPNGPYFLEMKGQFLFETGQIDQAIPFLQKATNNRPKSSSIRLMLSHALIESKDAKDPNSKALKEAVENLTRVVDQQSDNALAWRLMGTAYGKMNQNANAAACLAEEAFQLGNIQLAQMQAVKGVKAPNVSLAKRSEDLLQQIKIAAE